MNGMTALILFAGEGARFGSEVPKQFHRLSGKKIYLHTLEKFLTAQLFEEIILVCPENWKSEVEKEVAEYQRKEIKVISGGPSRHDSCYIGLRACGKNTQYVVIHDGVRPFVSHEILRANIEGVMKYGAVDTCIPSTDTIAHSSSGTHIDSIPKRSELLRGQTPQSFSYSLILEAHERARKLGLEGSDDCSFVVAMNKEIFIVQGDERNIKITSALDLYIGEQILRLEQKIPDLLATSLQGKRYAIAGGTGGIGQAVCALLKQEGAEALIIARSSSDYPADLTSSQETNKVFKKIGPLDGLINCVGQFDLKSFESLSVKEIKKQINTNLLSCILCCRFAKIKDKGHIVNIASSSYARGRKNYALYSSSKAAVVNFTQALSEEWPHIRVNALVPQRTKTKMRAFHFPNESEESLLQPEEVAKTIAQILKQDALTGTIFEVRKN
ncbi:MAG TPA: 2-C-methyl-D-erythritol 4-phosphate cytidylyltransferase [Rhabdochlamydiaceae bacterium]|nr:2-C-methyl-D-erythritol 4-phosphate cytidylyltransferase [Rhabdochlamydiaceae bacterium]